MVIRNNGLKDSEPAEVTVYADGKSVKNFELEELKIGYGKAITFTNIFILQTKVDEINVFVNTDFEELDKENNKVVLKIKEN